MKIEKYNNQAWKGYAGTNRKMHKNAHFLSASLLCSFPGHNKAGIKATVMALDHDKYTYAPTSYSTQVLVCPS